MSVIQVRVAARDPKTEAGWVRELSGAVDKSGGVRFFGASDASQKETTAQVTFVDAATPDLARLLSQREGRALFLVVDESALTPDALMEGKVDDVLVRPFRPLEVLSKLRHYQQLLLWDEVSSLNTSFSQLLERFHDDLKLAERLQKSKLPARFPDTKGFKTASRYLAGMKSGGDHFDLAESKDGNQLSMVLSDSSSYGLSSAVLSILMRVAVKLSAEESRSCKETVKKIHEELVLTLSEKDKLSLFYGMVSRKDYKLRYLNLGTSCAYYAPPKGGFQELPVQGPFISQKSGLNDQKEAEVPLEPGSRLALISDGFIETVGSSGEMKKLLDQFREADTKDALNEMVFRVKAAFTEPDDLPAQDCTAILFEIDSRIIRAL